MYKTSGEMGRLHYKAAESISPEGAGGLLGENLVEGTFGRNSEESAAVEFGAVGQEEFLVGDFQDLHQQACMVFVVGGDLVVAGSEGGNECLGNLQVLQFAKRCLPQKGIQLDVVVAAQRNPNIMCRELVELLDDGHGICDNRQVGETGLLQELRQVVDSGR